MWNHISNGGKRTIHAIKLLLFAFLCIGTLFAESCSFIDPQLVPKWALFYIIGGILISFYAIIKCFCYKNDSSARSCKVLSFGIISLICCFQAIYGIGQYLGIFNSNMVDFVTGSFDNPAGFAACLVAGLPCFLCLSECNKYLKVYVYLLAGIVILGVVVSGSRAGLMSIICIIIVMCNRFLHLPKGMKNIKYIVVPLFLIFLFIGLYFMKKDSANGRLLIWKCSLEMIKDKPLLGHGRNSFNAKYMLYQADYFKKHPDSKYLQLADNVKHPFNEFLLVAVDYGMTGLLVVIGYIVLIGSVYRNNNGTNFISLLSLIAIGVFACFSYPFQYPFVWVMLILHCYFIFKSSVPVVSAGVRKICCVLALLTCALIGESVWTFVNLEREWYHIATKSLLGKTEEVLPQYKLLHSMMKDNFLFLYNYAAELNSSRHYEKSIDVLEECLKGHNDYDVQMLLADNLEKVNQWNQAEQHYQLAARMCPNRFMPLYRLVKVYQLQDKEEKAQKLASAIIMKEIKVPSAVVERIKMDLKQYIKITIKGDV